MYETMTAVASECVAAHSSEQIQRWIVQRLSHMLGAREQEIHVDDPLQHYGLESVEALALFGELSDRLGLKISPTFAWDHSTIADLSRFLSGELAAKARAAQGS
jgi:acyl carrier protein